MRVSDLLRKFDSLTVKNIDLDTDISGISHDNRAITEGDVFAALAGFNQHGFSFAEAAIKNGARLILTDAEAASSTSLPCLISPNPRRDMGLIANFLYGEPQSVLRKIGITGTNGKTTTANMCFAILQANGLAPVLIGTTGIKFGNRELPAKRTTPEATELHKLLATAVAAQSDSLVMEVSSHALELNRVVGVKYQVAIFTGLSQDHLDFHENMDSYFAAKARLFTTEYAEFGVINVDDEWGAKLAKISEIPFVTYATTRSADWMAEDVEIDESGRTSFVAVGPTASYPLTLQMPGSFNVANALAAMAAAAQLRLSMPKSVPALSEVQVAGRLERINAGQPFVVLVDYAHTPDAVERVLEVARTCASNKVISVLGCGGDRDKAKRPLMGEAAAVGSDIVVITDDNPRSEDPAEIRHQILQGISTNQVTEIIENGDRRLAITQALHAAQPGDCVIVLGKGHEVGQEIAGTVYPFSDQETIREVLAEIYG